MKGKYIIMLKFHHRIWKPYFSNHCFDYDYAKQLYDKLCKNFNSSEWMLINIDNIHSKDKFEYIKED